MNSERTRLTIEVVGIVAIVTSLIFVGFQMRQTHEIALVTLTQMRSDAGRELAAAQLGSEPLYAIYEKINQGVELSAYEELTLSMQPFLFFNQFENSHFLYVKGYITEEQWQSDLVAIAHFTNNDPIYSDYWSEQKHIFRKSYIEAIDQSLARD
jgi:hypothetical protein